MITFDGVDAVPADWPASVVTIGKFDGVHAGHRAVIGEVLAIAEREQLASVVITFDRNPLALLRPDACPESLVSVEQKLELLGGTGLSATLLVAFDESFAAQTPEEFVRRQLVDALHARHVLVGSDFRFGARGAGTLDGLRELGERFGFEVHVIPDVRPGGERRVSSTWIRELLDAGDVVAATELLGHVPAVRGEVVHGAARGRELGFPTANLSPQSEGLIPADGVYAGYLVDDGVRYPAAISVGDNPTFEGVPQRQVEAYVIDEDLELYGHVVTVEFSSRIRGMVAYEGIDPLIAQIAADVATARALLPLTELDPRPLWAGRTLALLGILLVALNLRTAVSALSPIVAEIRVDLALPLTLVGVLGMLPPICFAVFGIVTPAITRRFGLEAVMIGAIVAMVLGHAGRALAPSGAVLVVASAVTFAGMGAGNVLLPPLVKKYFPDRVGLVTSVYVSILAISTLIPPLVAVPIADSAGWRVSLGVWAFVAVAALIPWVTLVIRHRTGASDVQPEEAEPAMLGRVWHSATAWGLALIFAVSSLNAYALFAWLPSLLADVAGTTPAQAGVLLSLYAAIGLPGGVIVPWLAARMRRVGILVYVGVLFFLLGYLGLLFAPTMATWLWVAFAGTGPLLFPLALVLINLRSRTRAGSVALSGFVQGVGYSIGSLGPLIVGVLHELSGGWTLPLVFLAATALVAIFAGAVVARPHMVEDARRR